MRCRDGIQFLKAGVGKQNPRLACTRSIRDPHGAVENEASAALLQFDAKPNWVFALSPAWEFDFRDRMQVFR